MRSIFNLSRFLFLTVCFSTTLAYASECNSQKVYLLPENILITEQGIFYFDSESFLQPAAGLLVDVKGIYAIKPIQACSESDNCPRDSHSWGESCPHNCPGG